MGQGYQEFFEIIRVAGVQLYFAFAEFYCKKASPLYKIKSSLGEILIINRKNSKKQGV